MLVSDLFIIFHHFAQGFYTIFSTRLGGSKTYDSMGIVVFFPVVEAHLLIKLFHLFIIYNTKDLIGWIVNIKREVIIFAS